MYTFFIIQTLHEVFGLLSSPAVLVQLFLTQVRVYETRPECLREFGAGLQYMRTSVLFNIMGGSSVSPTHNNPALENTAGKIEQ